MENEIWKPIISYEGLYEISNYGNVKSLRKFHGNNGNYKERILKPRKDKNGYLEITLCKNNKRKIIFIHRLVLGNFIGLCPEGMEVCHNDSNPSNNFVGNLRYDTHYNNMKDAINKGTHFGLKNGSECLFSKLNEKQVRIIKWLLKDGYLTQKEIAIIFNVDPTTISCIKRNITWKHVN